MDFFILHNKRFWINAFIVNQLGGLLLLLVLGKPGA